jgi:F-type H+-transporting ATPase subunit b
MPQFDTTTYVTQVFWLLVCFSVLCIFMRFLVVPRLASALEMREQRLQEDWNQAKTLTQTWESLRQEDLMRLSEARGNSHSLIHQMVQEINIKKSKRLALLDEELALKTKIIRQDLEKQTGLILENMEPLVSQVVKATARRVLGQPLTQKEIRKVVLTVLHKPEPC